MKRWMIGIVMLALATIGCNLGAEPTLAPTQFVSTATVFVFSTQTPISQPTATFDIAVVPPVVNNTTCNYPNGWQRYVVVSGDTLGTIASRAGTNVDLLMSANCITNGDLIEVGQFIFVPKALLPVASATPAISSQIMQMSVQPANYISGQYRVQPGPIIIVADNVRAGTRIAFYYSYAGGQQNYLGSSPVFGLRAQFGWDLATLPQNATLYLTAVALDAINRYVQYSNQIIVIRADSPIIATLTVAPVFTNTPLPGPAVVGDVTITPSEFTNGRYRIRAGDVVVSAINVKNVEYVSWVLITNLPGSSPQSIALDRSPSGGLASARWTISGTQMYSGTLTAYGFYNNGQSYVQGGTVAVFYDPTQP